MYRIVLLSLVFLCSFGPTARSGELQSRALFVSIIQNPPVLTSRDAILHLVDFSKQAHVKTLFVQIYYRGQSWFPSQLADDRPYEQCRKTVGEDPLQLLITQAHRQGLEVHAWVNVMSLGNNAHAPFLKKFGTDVLTRNLIEKHTLDDFKIDKQFFLEPGDLRVRDYLAGIVKEILTGYPDLDGIQFDYIRYPDTHPHYGYTTMNMERFKKATGLKIIDEESVVWQDWRRAQVTETLQRLVSLVHTKRPHMQVSTTGCMPFVRAYYEAYQSWPSWLSTGLIDFVTIMDYATDVKKFESSIAVIKTKVNDFSKVRIAVGAYRLVPTPEIFEQEFSICEKMGAICTVFHYGSLLESPEFYRFLTTSEK